MATKKCELHATTGNTVLAACELYGVVVKPRERVKDFSVRLAYAISKGTEEQWETVPVNVQVWYDVFCSLAEMVRKDRV